MPDSSGSAGMDRRSSQKIANMSREKTIPAMAAALRGFQVRVNESAIFRHRHDSFNFRLVAA